MNGPFGDLLKRIGEQARNWENITDFGSDLDILQPNRRRSMASWTLIIAGAVFATFMILQAAFTYSQLRAQRIAIEKLQQTVEQLSSRKPRARRPAASVTVSPNLQADR